MARNFVIADSDHLTALTPPITGPPFTITVWIYDTTGTGNDDTVLQIQDDGVADNYFRIDRNAGDNFIRGITNDGTTTGSAVATTAIPLNTWAHVAFVGVNDADRRIFQDGGSVGTNVDTINPSNIDSWDIGREGDSTPGDPWGGRIAEVAVWNVAKTNAQIAQMGSNRLSALFFPTGLVAYYRLFGNESPERNLVGTDTLTVVNSPDQIDHPSIIYPSGPIIIPAAVAAAPGAPGGAYYQYYVRNVAA